MADPQIQAISFVAVSDIYFPKVCGLSFVAVSDIYFPKVQAVTFNLSPPTTISSTFVLNSETTLL
ncbi:MAG: hypothetical protein WC746_05355 [archaeon]|jgi:hypothetical protein